MEENKNIEELEEMIKNKNNKKNLSDEDLFILIRAIVYYNDLPDTNEDILSFIKTSRFLFKQISKE